MAQERLAPNRQEVVAKALMRATDLLRLSGRDLAATIGVSEATLSRMKQGQVRGLTGKAYELALLVIRLYRSLDAITGGDDEASRRWIRAPSSVLGGTPLERIRTVEGLSHVLAYLDARRAQV